MPALQAILGSFFSLLGALALFFLVLKAFQIAAEMQEIKDLLKELNRSVRYSGKGPLEGEWLNQSALDDADDRVAAGKSALPADPLKSTVQPQILESTQRESW